MVRNQLKEVEKNLRYIAKRNKSISFSIGLALLYLMLGMNAFSEEIGKVEAEKKVFLASRQEIGTSTDTLSETLKRIKEENEKKLKGANLELIQLMEQGDQVVKSPWASWQFGINYVYENGGSRFKGRGDKDNLYYYNKVFTRGNWKEKNALDSIEGKKPNGHPITPGSDSQHSWKNIDNSSSGGITIDKDTSIGSSTNGNRSWGLVDLRDLKEPTNEVEVLARIFPKEVKKNAVNIDIIEPSIEPLTAPKINPKVNTPLDPPQITIPEVEPVNISALTIGTPEAPQPAGAPTISIPITAPGDPIPPNIEVQPGEPTLPTAPNITINIISPEIKTLSIEKPATVVPPEIKSPEIKPVDFTVDPGGDSLKYSSDKSDTYGTAHQGWKSSWPKTIDVTELKNRDYVSLTRDQKDSLIPKEQVINVTAENNRAMVVDEVQKNGIEVNFQGTIRLQRKKNVGIDLQGTHTGSKTAPSIASIINSGTIVGEAKYNGSINENQIAFGFNNADASRNTTMTHMINKGTIELNAPSSAGIQLKPEDPHYWDPVNWNLAPLQIRDKKTNKTMGRVLMKADNKKDINLKGSNSFGILTVFNEGVPKNLFASNQSSHETLRKEREYDGERVLPGGEIGRSALEDNKYTSGIYNTGTITISGDNSIGIGLLQEIQEVKVDGNINVGKEDPNQEDGISNLNTNAKNKVENAVGVFAGVPTKPVKAGEKDTLIDNGNGGNVASKLVGTETIELGGNITLGEFASSSIGALVGDTEVKLDEGKENGNTNSDRKYKRSGDITAKASSKITVGGIKNYGFVVSNSAHSSKFDSATVDNLLYSVDKTKHGIGKNAGTIDVTGKESVGFVLIKGGHSENSGKILVSGNATDSIGFYGEEDQLTNQASGEISVTSAGEKNKGVVLNGKNTANVHFINAGKIITGNSIKGKEKVGVYAQGKYKFEHNTGANMEVGSNNIGFYVKDNTGTVTIKAPIVLSKSDGGTSIGVYSDGEAKVNFGENSKLEIGEGAVGLYSSEASKFNNTFNFESGKNLKVSLGKNATFALLDSNNNINVELAKFLNNHANQKIEIANFEEGASLVYAKNKVTAILNEDYSLSNSVNNKSTAVLVGTTGAKVQVAAGKTLDTDTHIGLVATQKATAENLGQIFTKRDSGVGLYASAATAKNAANAVIRTYSKESVAILGEKNSTLENSGHILLNEQSSVGIYGKDSNITQKTGGKIELLKNSSVGMYGTITGGSISSKGIKNEGEILALSGSSDFGSAGIYATLENSANQSLTVENSGNIKIAQNSSAGIYVKNESSQTAEKSTINNTGLIETTGKKSVGIISKKSKVSNSANNPSASSNPKGILVKEASSAGILATDHSKVSNGGDIELAATSVTSAQEGLVGISVDESSTVENTGNINVKSQYSTGISSKGGKVSNQKNILLEKTNSVAISATDADVNNTNPASIEVKEKESVGIYAKLTKSENKTVHNTGKILLNTLGAGTDGKSAAIYALLDGNGSGKLTTKNEGEITVGHEKSVGIYAANKSGQGKEKSEAINSKQISVSAKNSAGMIGEKSILRNTATASGEGIVLTANSIGGMIGKAESEVKNEGIIETKTATPTTASEGLVGISLDKSKGENTANGTINLDTKYSTGMYGKNSSDVSNKGSIKATKEYAIGMAGDSSTLTNSHEILLEAADSTGMFGKDNSTLLNDMNGKITAKKEKSVGMFSKNNSTEAINKGNIKTEGESSAGMFGEKGKLKNTNEILTEKKTSAGMYAKNTNAVNEKNITSKGESSAGILVELSDNNSNITGENTSNGVITTKGKTSAGMLGKVANGAGGSAKISLQNSNNIFVNSEKSVGMMVENKEANFPKENIIAKNTGIITLANNKTESIGMFADKAIGVNEKEIQVNGKQSIGMLGKKEAMITNEAAGTITLSEEKGIGMLAEDNNTVATNKGNILAKGKESSGMLAKANGKSVNEKTIQVSAEKGVGIFVSDTGIGENKNGAEIHVKNKEGVGIFALNNSKTGSAINYGIIRLGETGASYESLIGMFAKAENNKKASVKNASGAKIVVNTKKSVGMYAINEAASVDDVELSNEGSIEVNTEGSAGMYVPKANISKVGTIILSEAANGSSAVYVSKAGKVTTDGAKIQLGKKNQNQVAYYVNGKDSALQGTKIGDISGYGVGVYLQGNSATDVASLTATTPELDYTSSPEKGKGLIGLLLKGDTNISAYNKKIAVGDTVEASGSEKAKYAIGIYADKQGTDTNPYKIPTTIHVGAKGVGIFADKASVIQYNGSMTLGDGTTAGTGFFISQKSGSLGASKVTLGSGSITLNGNGGAVAIVSEEGHFDGGSATINLNGSGVGVYGLKGSVIKVDNWTFNNKGHQAEEVRLKEGQLVINPTSGEKTLKPKMVLSHVINGETYLESGKTVKAVQDSTLADPNPRENIGLMAEGVKNSATPPTGITWKDANFEIENYGTIDFSNSKKSTAIYAQSARVKNDGSIKVGESSTGIYAKYDPSSPTLTGITNKVEVETTTKSVIELGNESTGMYFVDAEKVTNLGGSITSASNALKNVGIYVKNKDKILHMDNKANITLGDGAVGLFSSGKGENEADRNTVKNTGNITVGKKITAGGKIYPSVALYAEKTNLETDSSIKVGEDGIAFYGKRAKITAKGNVDFSNKGVLAYLEDHSEFTSYLGDLSSTENTMIYLKDSKANLAGSGTNVNMTVADGYTGAYIGGSSSLNGVKTIQLGKNSNGLFLKNATFTSEVEEITSDQEGAKGILALDSDLTNKTKINLSGNNSIGVYSNATALKNFVNEGELTLSGEKTLGIFLKGEQTFENKANIYVKDSVDVTKPSIGIFTKEGKSSITHSSGNIEVGSKSIGIYSLVGADVAINGGKLHVKDEGIGIYKQNGKVILKGDIEVEAHVSQVENTEPVAVYGVNGTEIQEEASKIEIGKKSYGFILSNTDDNKINTFTNTNTGTVKMADESTYLYSSGKAKITNNRNLSSNGANRLISFYIKEKGEFTNNGIIDFSNGKGNLGIYAPGGKATNKGTILVGKTDDIDPITGKIYTDLNKIVYGIGMAADNTGKISNEGEIRVSENKSIGMYGSGLGTIVENTESGKIYLDGSKATDSNKIESMTGVYVDNGATFTNKGLITTIDSYAGRDEKVNENVNGLVGVAVMNGSTLINEAGGKILIDAGNSYGVIIRGKRDASGNVERYAVIKNYGEIKVRGKGTWGISWRDVKPEEIAALEAQINKKITSDPPNQEIRQAAGTDKELEGVKITVVNGKPIFSRNGIEIPEAEVEQIGKLIGKESNLGLSDIGFYVDTLGKTKPIDLDGGTPPIDSQLIIGTEYSEMTNAKQWHVKEGVIKPFLEQIQGRNFKLKSLAGSLTWMATPILNANEEITGIAMAKIPYTSFVKQTDNAYNFTDGLEQRYDMNELNSPEKRIFNLLNGIGKNEEVLLTQAYDEMMGHQYANVQQRIQVTGNILDNEFKYLKREWSNPSKDSNKIKVFGTRGEYNTGTASVIDYKNHAEGVAYLHEKETFQLGNSTGWYTGFIHNQFKFKDIGKSREEMYQTKLGMFKSMAFDHNNSLHWTISGEMFLGRSKMNRRYLVVDEIFHAKSKYWSYGFAINNEVSKSFRTGESTFIKPYGELKLEYGRFQKIKEKDGEIRLEVKENDYYSVKPKIGVEAGYLHQFGNGISFKTSFGVSYENELGQVADTKNKARVAYTNADYFALPGEKEDRRGNLRTDLNLGLNNEAYGVTANIGYDTKGNKVRGGLGVRVIF
ncbi:membrane protein [Fusobacterium necrophorum DAB]|uniref:autotransporter-associated N-terminal domain-containing protein n=1 Tax=Fusobacterium necrophorum TaxID=859 RepID=UPI000460FBF1|nr:autotransporter-associated N-terminal domain-containing protein [Fusobacterium necrophorum]KDE69364.1 membrane protein [Fusobacterium necrophorum DAB]